METILDIPTQRHLNKQEVGLAEIIDLFIGNALQHA